MRVSFDGHHFICSCTFDERHLPKEAGFMWNPETREWYTPELKVAVRLREHMNETAKVEIAQVSVVESPWSDRLTYPGQLSPRPFQETAARWALTRNHSYLALDPGLGKTVTAALVINALPVPTLYVCPPFLTLNTEAELLKWRTHEREIARYVPGGFMSPDVLIMPDSMIHKDAVLADILYWRSQHRNEDALLIVDEAHRFKNLEAKRTESLFRKIAKLFPRKIFLSGTPMPNRPIELLPVLSHVAAETIGYRDGFSYALRYCAAFEGPHGWDFSGASNMGELVGNVKKSFMLRMKKDDVLPELPPKTEELVFIGDNLPPKIAAMERKILETHAVTDLVGNDRPGTALSTYRKEVGLAKVEEAASYLRALLHDSGESVLVFAHHTEVIAKLIEELDEFKPLVITGATPMGKRQDIVAMFQTSNRRLFIGNIQASGTGFTLTKATRVVFVEFSWVPAENDQASDRAHRIGQRDHVFVQYLVFKNSIDKDVMDTVLKKRKIIERV